MQKRSVCVIVEEIVVCGLGGGVSQEGEASGDTIRGGPEGKFRKE